MDTEDEANSYLKYLNDSDATTTFLLGSSEPGLFSVEPIFTEIEATDWPQEGFPMLLSQSLIQEESSEENPSSSEETCNNIESYDASKFPIENTCPGSDIETINTQEDKNSLQQKEVVYPPELHIPDNDENIVSNTSSQLIQLLNVDGTPINLGESVLKPKSLPTKQQNAIENEDKTLNSLNDLFTTVKANKCKLCSFLIESLDFMYKHLREEHPESLLALSIKSNGVSLLLSNQKINKQRVNTEYTVYVCSICHHVCLNKQDLKLHMIEMHEMTTESDKKESDDDFEEEINQEKVEKPKSKTTLIRELAISVIKKEERALQKIKCTYPACRTGFPTNELRLRHEALHLEGSASYFKCECCDETFKMWRVARNHMYKLHGVDFGMMNCPMCKIFKSYNIVVLAKHMAIHTDDKPYLCAKCGKCFKQLSQLKNHETIHRAPEDMPNWTKLSKCDRCHRFFANSNCLKKHIQAVHEKVKPYICNICGHKTTRKAVLELHMRQHTGDKPFKCEYCTYNTRDKNCLRKHTQRHLGSKSYKCPHCCYSCIQSSSLKNHLKKNHKGNGLYKCRYCSYQSINELSLGAHEKLHEIKSAGDHNDGTYNNGERNQETELQTDEETQSCFLNAEPQMEDTIDNGGITIPAGLELPLVS